MNQSIDEKLDAILRHTDGSVRDELRRHLLSCHFSDPEDPTLNALLAQAFIAAQPLRLAESAGAQLATETGLARLGDRVENATWSVARLRIATVGVACFLFFSLGGIGAFAAMKFGAEKLPSWLRSQDSRLEFLARRGAQLKVEEDSKATYVHFVGGLQPQAGRTQGGKNYLYFPR